MKILSSTVPILLTVLVAACANDIGGPAKPRTGITLHVINSTCVSGHCDSLWVEAFPTNQPNTPGGFWKVQLGMITTPEACYTLPPSANFYVIRSPPRSSADTTTYTWTSSIPLQLGAYPTSTNLIMVNPITLAFVAADSPGWSIAVPGDKQATASASCVPTSP